MDDIDWPRVIFTALLCAMLFCVAGAAFGQTPIVMDQDAPLVNNKGTSWLIAPPAYWSTLSESAYGGYDEDIGIGIQTLNRSHAAGAFARRYQFDYADSTLDEGTYDVYVTWPTVDEMTDPTAGNANPVTVIYDDAVVGDGHSVSATYNSFATCTADLTIEDKPFKRLFQGLQFVEGGTYGFLVLAECQANKDLYFDAIAIVRTGDILESVATPTFSPAAGTYTTAQSVTISTATSGATIRYTTDGSTPTSSSGTIYSGAVSVSATTTLKAIAYKSGMLDSGVASGTFTINDDPVAAPTFTPGAGTYSAGQNVTIASSTSGATIRFTLDGSTPTATTGTIYSAPVRVASSRTLKAIAYKSGMPNSSVTTGAYTIALGSPAPRFSPAGGAFGEAFDLTITSALSGATIRYTTDGTTPTTTSGTIYSGPIAITEAVTVRAIAYTSGSVSAVSTASYEASDVTGEGGAGPGGSATVSDGWCVGPGFEHWYYSDGISYQGGAARPQRVPGAGVFTEAILEQSYFDGCGYWNFAFAVCFGGWDDATFPQYSFLSRVHTRFHVQLGRNGYVKVTPAAMTYMGSNTHNVMTYFPASVLDVILDDPQGMPKTMSIDAGGVPTITSRWTDGFDDEYVAKLRARLERLRDSVSDHLDMRSEIPRCADQYFDEAGTGGGGTGGGSTWPTDDSVPTEAQAGDADGDGVEDHADPKPNDAAVKGFQVPGVWSGTGQAGDVQADYGEFVSDLPSWEWSGVDPESWTADEAMSLSIPLPTQGLTLAGGPMTNAYFMTLFPQGHAFAGWWNTLRLSVRALALAWMAYCAFCSVILTLRQY